MRRAWRYSRRSRDRARLRRQRESGIFAKDTQAINDVLPEIVNPRDTTLVAAGFFERGDVAERAVRRLSCRR
jgi:hypothetical protein